MIYNRIYKYLEDEIGLDINSIGTASIDSSIKLLMTENNIETIDELLHNLKHLPKFHSLLFEKIIVPETWFFRDAKPFEFLSIWLRQNKVFFQREKLKILSAPCSTGEEPYSIAIALTEQGLPKDSFRIDAIDISGDSIIKAKKAEYHKISFRGDDKYFLDKYFTPRGDKRFGLKREIRDMVDFRQDNILRLITIKPFEKYHVIFFKNLLIYLNADARMKTMNKIKQLLHPKGVLFTGHTETSYFLQYGFSMVKYPHSFALSINKANTAIAKDKVINNIQSKASIKTNARKDFTLRDTNGTSKQIEPAEITDSTEIKEEKTQLGKIKQLADKGYFDKALDMCIEYSGKNKSDYEAYFLQGLIYEAINDKDNAAIQYNKVLYLMPDHSDALLHLSLLYESAGLEKQARSVRERLLRLKNK